MIALTCPLCRGEVAAGSSGCSACRLPMSDMVAGQPRSRASRSARWFTIRVTGLLLYGGAIFWSATRLQDTLVFVVPGAVLGGGLLHVVKGRPWWGLAVFVAVVVGLPFLLSPALGVGFWTTIRDGG